MKYEHIRLIQIAILTIYSLLTKEPIPYLVALILTSFRAYRSLVCSIIAASSLFINALIYGQYIMPIGVGAVVGVLQLLPFAYEK